MSTYLILSSLFKLSKNINLKVKILSDEDKKNKAEEFISLCNELLSQTVKTEDEKFMILSFITVNENIINWSLSKCLEKTGESYKIYKYNFINEYKKDKMNNF